MDLLKHNKNQTKQYFLYFVIFSVIASCFYGNFAYLFLLLFIITGIFVDNETLIYFSAFINFLRIPVLINLREIFLFFSALYMIKNYVIDIVKKRKKCHYKIIIAILLYVA